MYQEHQTAEATCTVIVILINIDYILINDNTFIDLSVTVPWPSNVRANQLHIDYILPLKVRGSGNYDTSCPLEVRNNKLWNEIIRYSHSVT